MALYSFLSIIVDRSVIDCIDSNENQFFQIVGAILQELGLFQVDVTEGWLNVCLLLFTYSFLSDQNMDAT